MHHERHLNSASLFADTGGHAFVFPPVGSQHPHMGFGLFISDTRFREAILECDELLGTRLPASILSILYPFQNQEWAAVLDQAAFSQPILLALQHALVELWHAKGITHRTPS